MAETTPTRGQRRFIWDLSVRRCASCATPWTLADDVTIGLDEWRQLSIPILLRAGGASGFAPFPAGEDADEGQLGVQAGEIGGETGLDRPELAPAADELGRRA